MHETIFIHHHIPFDSPSFLLPIFILLSGLAAMGILSSFRPNGRISFFHSKENRLFLTKISDQSGSKEKIALPDLCRAATPSTCHLNPLLFNGHLQTAWTTVKNYDIPIYYKRKMFESDNPMYSGQFAVDFVVEPYETPDDDEVTDKARKYTLPSGLPSRTFFFTQDELAALPSDDTKPMLVLLHGLSGGSHELYLRHVLEALLVHGSWEACVVNSRGCSQTKISSGVLYNARATWDVRQTVKWLRKTFPNRPLFGIGFSLGANILANVCITIVLKTNMQTVVVKERTKDINFSLLPFVVLGRGRRCVPVKSSSPRCEPLEFRNQLPVSATDLVRHGSVQQDDGL